MKLTAEALRVLGCLLEKAATTPDAYPLSSAALVTACNQSSNRDPVVSFEERQVDAAMLELRELGMARTIRGAGHRVHKHRHVADELLGSGPAELAVLAVLMLRGAQTPGELNTRTQRYGADLDLDRVEAILSDLAEREPPLVERLERRPGEREARWVQCLGEDAEPAAPVASPDPSPPQLAATPAPAPGPVRGATTTELEDRVAALEEVVAALRRDVAALVENLGG